MQDDPRVIHPSHRAFSLFSASFLADLFFEACAKETVGQIHLSVCATLLRDVSSILAWIWVLLLMFLGYFYLSRAQPSKPLKTFVFTMNFNDFTIQRNMIFDDFPDLFRYQFWHLFLMSFGIDFGSILGPLWHQTSCFWVIIFVDDFSNSFFLFFFIFDQKDKFRS